MTDAAQADGGGALAGTGLRVLPVRRRAIGTGQHRVCLSAQKVNPARPIGPPAGVVMIISRHGLGFRLLGEREQLIPAAREFEKEVERTAHGLEPGIRSGEEERQGRGHARPGGIERREAVVFVVAVLHDQRIGVLFLPVAGFRDDLGPFAP
jgi:hypothetical protein